MPMTMKNGVIQEPEFDQYLLDLERKAQRMKAALQRISDRRSDLAAASRNDYDAGYSLATEMCCDIADDALAPHGLRAMADEIEASEREFRPVRSIAPHQQSEEGNNG